MFVVDIPLDRDINWSVFEREARAAFGDRLIAVNDVRYLEELVGGRPRIVGGPQARFIFMDGAVVEAGACAAVVAAHDWLAVPDEAGELPVLDEDLRARVEKVEAGEVLLRDLVEYLRGKEVIS